MELIATKIKILFESQKNDEMRRCLIEKLGLYFMLGTPSHFGPDVDFLALFGTGMQIFFFFYIFVYQYFA